MLNGDENGSHTFTKNGEFTFMIQDEAGNIGYVTAKVTWITAKDTEVVMIYMLNQTIMLLKMM